MKRDESFGAVSASSSCQVSPLLLFGKLLSRVGTAHTALLLPLSPFSTQGCLS